MQNTDTITIYHIYRKNGSSLFLHPLKKKSSILKKLENHQLQGFYGHEPRIESITLFRNELYRIIEQEVHAWVADARFIPRFLLSAAAFIISYFFMSFVIRDPLPILDEIAISLGISITAYILLGKRDQRSDLALKKRISLRNRVDTVVFNQKNLLHEIEDILHTYEELDRAALCEKLFQLEPLELEHMNKDDLSHLVSYLESYFSSGDYEKKRKKITRYYQGKLKDREKNAICRWAKLQRVDLPLFVLAVQLKITLNHL
jgi:hypothetical protein